jgi:monoamine oxidase
MSNSTHAAFLSRREMLRLLAAAATAPALPMLSAARTAAAERTPIHVVIVGAGLAGLVAAYELEKLGHRATILEAERTHIGGRARTLRFENGLYGEAGAMRIPEKHDLTRHYCKEFGLTLRTFVMGNPKAYYHIRGKRVRAEDVKQLNPLFALRPDEQEKTPDDFFAATVVKQLEALTDVQRAELLAPQLPSDVMRQLDQLSLQQLCEGEGLSQEAIEFLMSVYGNEPLIHSAATEYLREEMLKLWSLKFDEIVGGTDTLAAAFASKLQTPPRQGCEVIRLENGTGAESKSAIAVYRNGGAGGAIERVVGDYVLCTLACPVLQRIDTPLSGEKMRAVRQLAYDSSTKVLTICKERFWESADGIYGGGSFTDLPTGSTYYPSDNADAKDAHVSAAPAVMLASYSWGQNARRLGLLPVADRHEVALRYLAKLHPQVAQEGTVLRTESFAWDQHKWTGGAFAWFNPGQHTHLHRHLLTPEGRIHFAGEHTSLAHTWLQGALESGLRAVKEMTTAL